MRYLWVLALICPGAAFAEGSPVTYDPGVLEACLATHPGAAQADCIGIGAQYCMALDGQGSSNVGAGFCFGAERDDWDARLNAACQAVLKADEKTDAEMKELGLAVAPQAPALREMQRAWIAYRDAACNYEMTTWGGGSGAGPAGSECEMRMSGRAALDLMARAARVKGK